MCNEILYFLKRKISSGKFTGECTLVLNIYTMLIHVFMDVCFILSLSDDGLKRYVEMEKKTRHALKEPKPKGPQKCPVEGCGRVVVKLWNHLQRFHMKYGLWR